MGTFQKLKTKQILEKNIAVMQQKTADNETAFGEMLNKYASQIRAHMSIDQERRAKRTAIAIQVMQGVSAVCSFFPVYGATVTMALNTALGAATKKQGAAAFVTTAVQYNLTPSNAVTIINADNLAGSNQFAVNSMKDVPRYDLGGGVSATLGAAAGMVTSLLNDKQQLGKGDIVITSRNKLDNELDSILLNHAKTIAEGYAALNKLQENEKRSLVPLVFYMQVKEMQVGGRGNLLLDTGYAETPNGLYKSIDEIAASLGDLQKTSTAWYQGNSGLIIRLKLYSQKTSYTNWFGGQPEARHLISSICLQKAKILAYAEEYVKQIDTGWFGQSFKDRLGVTANDRYLPACYAHSNASSATYDKFGKAFDASREDQRKEYMLGMYVFHAILEHHLGTYNLASLPPYGVSTAVDNAVQKALIDAFATQFWVTSRAYTKNGSEISAKPIIFADNMLDAKMVLNWPYIAPYFDPKRTWTSQGRSIALASSVFEGVLEIKKANLMSSAKNNDSIAAYQKTLDASIDVLIDKATEDPRERLEDYKKKLVQAKDKLAHAVGEEAKDFAQADVKFYERWIGRFEEAIKEAKDSHETTKATQQTALNNLSGSIKKFQTEAQIRTQKSYDSSSPPTLVNIDNQFLLGLMPDTVKSFVGFDVAIKGRLKILYENITDKATESDILLWISDGILDAEADYKAAVYKKDSNTGKFTEEKLDYKTNISAAYEGLAATEFSTLYDDDGQSVKSKADIKQTYINALFQAASDADDNVSFEDTIEVLANVHMGALLSTSNSAQFDQAEFNRAAARAMKRMWFIIAELVKSNDMINDKDLRTELNWEYKKKK